LSGSLLVAFKLSMPKMKYKIDESYLVKSDVYTIGSCASCPINYIYAPKNACGSLKASLLNVDVNPHLEFQQKFIRSVVDVNKPMFCVTRNPYDRAISGYLNKIANHRDVNVWKAFCQRYNLDCSVNLSFQQFLSLLLSDDNPHCLDLHFRPQCYVHNAFFIRPYFVGRFERMQETEIFLKGFGISLRILRANATDAASKRKFLSKEDINLITQIYKLDFETYGYDMDPSVYWTPPTVFQQQSISPEFIRKLKLRNEKAGLLKTPPSL